MLETKRPNLEMLSKPFVEQIISEAMDVLEKTGVLVENEEALRLFKDTGCELQGQTVFIKEDIVHRALETTP